MSHMGEKMIEKLNKEDPPRFVSCAWCDEGHVEGSDIHLEHAKRFKEREYQ